MAPLLRVRRAGRRGPGRPIVVAPGGAPMRRRRGPLVVRGIVVIIALLVVAFLAWRALAS